MSMSPNNYVGIKKKYNEIRDRIDYITDDRNPISQPYNNINELQEVSALEECIQIALKNLSPNSSEKEKYEEMLTGAKRLRNNLYHVVKEDLDNGFK